jgi:molybdate transport system regulatory protein
LIKGDWSSDVCSSDLDIERVFGGVVLERRTGGKAGGGAALTAKGRDIVKHFRAAEKRTARAIKGELEALNNLKG